MDKNKLLEELINKVENNNHNFNPNNFIDEKIKNFCEFILSKEIKDLQNNIIALKFMYGVGGLSVFVKHCLIPIKDKLENPIPENQEEILKLICPKEKIKEIITKFSEEEKNRITKFMNFLIDSIDLL